MYYICDKSLQEEFDTTYDFEIAKKVAIYFDGVVVDINLLDENGEAMVVFTA